MTRPGGHRKQNLLLGAAMLVLLLVFVYSLWNLLSEVKEYRLGEQNYQDLAQTYTAQRPTEPKEEPLPSPDTQTEPVSAETAPIAVDFGALLAQCPDVVGWLYCPDTPIHYPVVQSQDNDYYLYRLMDGTYNSSGSLFMDYRCSGDFSDWNHIIYGHNMKNDTMFGTLQDYKKQEYYDAHPVWYLLTPEGDYRIDLIGGYTTPGTDRDTYGLPNSQDDRDALIEKTRQRSTFQTDTQVGDGERLVTLSTCAYDYDQARYVLIGVLRPLETSVKG